MPIAPTFKLASCAGQRTVVVALVLVAHGLILADWRSRTPAVAIAPTEMRVSFTVSQNVPAPAVLPAPRTPPVLPRKMESPAVRPASVTAESAFVEQAAPVLPNAVTEALLPGDSPGADNEPDYKAAYLRNPSPVYPLAARRMGLQGKVVLNVEVLAEGRCGQIEVKQSSGHDTLDNAALQTVRGWRFVPARHAGLAVSRWFLVPVQFQLRNEES